MKKQEDDIENLFNQVSNNDMSKVLNELFNEKKISMITDLTSDEIKLCTKIYMIANIKKVNIWIKGLEFYLKLALSKDRKSRKEIIDSFKGLRQDSFISKLNPINWGRR